MLSLPQAPTPSPEASFFYPGVSNKRTPGHPFTPAVGSHQRHPSILSAPMESELDPASPSLWKAPSAALLTTHRSSLLRTILSYA